MYSQQSVVLPCTVLDSKTYDVGKHLVRCYVARVGLLGMSEKDAPSIDEVDGPNSLLNKVRKGKSVTINRRKVTVTQPVHKQKDISERRRERQVNSQCKVLKAMLPSFNTCQAVVDVHGNKHGVAKHAGIRNALVFLLTTPKADSFESACPNEVGEEADLQVGAEAPQ